MTYDFDFEYILPVMGEGLAVGAVGAVLAVVAILLLFAVALSVVSYVLSAVGLYRIAKRRGIHHAWLAWIPVGNSWLLGSVSDHYQYVVKHKTTKRRKLLLILNAVALGLEFVSGFAGTFAGLNLDFFGGAVGMTALMFLAYVAAVGVSIAVMIISYIAYYDLFQSCKPSNAVLFLVLGIVFSVTLPFFVFACSNSDKGMPERRAPRSEEPQSIPEEANQEEAIPVVEAEVVDTPFEE